MKVVVPGILGVTPRRGRREGNDGRELTILQRQPVPGEVEVQSAFQKFMLEAHFHLAGRFREETRIFVPRNAGQGQGRRDPGHGRSTVCNARCAIGLSTHQSVGANARPADAEAAGNGNLPNS